MRYLYSDFRAWKEPFSEGYMMKFSLYSKLLSVILTLYLWKVVGTLYLDSSFATFKYILLSWVFVRSLNCLVMSRLPWWFECFFRRSSSIHCWLLLAVLLDYFGHLITSTFLLFKSWGLPGFTPVSFPTMRRWKCLGMKRSSQPSSITPGKQDKKSCRSRSRR